MAARPAPAKAGSAAGPASAGQASTTDPAPAEGEPAPWPGAADEAAFLAQGREAGEAAEAPESAPPAPERLPSLEEMIARVPKQVRELMDDLFRARFTSVRRVSDKDIDRN